MADLTPALLALLVYARHQEETFVKALPDEAREARGNYEEWSVRDTLAHVAAWKERTARELAAAVGSGSPPPGDNLEQVNATIYETYRDWSWREVLAFSRRAYDDLVAQAERMNREDLLIVGVPDWHKAPLWELVVDDGFSHTFTHILEYYEAHGAGALAATTRHEADARLLQFRESI